uniref:F8A1 protein n=1 Tax=Echinococcus granulosus TaxID=6210 RepID=A0A068WHL5_ECHGR|nr:F8A1 protein [Echinococcus granulosus]
MGGDCREIAEANVDEARNDFAYIAKLLATEDTYEYAAVFALGKAQCEALNSDGFAEAAALMEAGRLFARAEENLQTSTTLSSGELLEHAISCLLKAAKVYESCVSLTHAANCYIFCGDILSKSKRLSEAINVYSHAADIFCRDAPRVTHILMKCLQIYILTRDYSSALNTVFKIQTLSMDACETHGYEIELFLDLLKETEVYRVLLVLSTLPPKSKEISKEGPLSLTAYVDDAAESMKDNFARYLESGMFLYLKSLILAYMSEDLASLDTTASFIQSEINPSQRRILQDLLDNATSPPDDIF